MDSTRHPDRSGTETHPTPDEAAQDPAPEISDPRDRGGTGRPVGADTIREGRADGVMTPQGSTQGEGGGG